MSREEGERGEEKTKPGKEKISACVLLCAIKKRIAYVRKLGERLKGGWVVRGGETPNVGKKHTVKREKFAGN